MRMRRYRGDEPLSAGGWAARAGHAAALRHDAPGDPLSGVPIARADTASRIASVLDLQRSAGNAAATSVVTSVSAGGREASTNRSAGRRRMVVGHAAKWSELAPPDGIKTIRSHMKPGGALGHTVAAYDEKPPLFAIAGTEKVEGGHVARVRRERSGEPDHEVEIPKAGRHHIRDLGEGSRQLLDVSPEWASKIRVGEQEHIDDSMLAWRLTWKAIVDAMETVSAERPRPAPTPAAAEEAAWAAFRARLPAWLRPPERSESAQRAAWEIRKGTPVHALVTATDRLRDGRGWHTPQSSMDREERGDRIDALDTGRSRIGAVKPEALIEEAIKTLPRP